MAGQWKEEQLSLTASARSTGVAVAGPAQAPLRLQILHEGQLLRELQANGSAQVREAATLLPPALASCCVTHCTLLFPQDPGFAEVLPNLTHQEMDWLVQGELQVALERTAGPELHISGHIAARQSCDGEAGWDWHSRVHSQEPYTCQKRGQDGFGGDWGARGVSDHGANLPPPVLAVLQSVLCGADALTPVQTGAAGSASLTLLGNGSLIYQVRLRSCRAGSGAARGQASVFQCHTN